MRPGGRLLYATCSLFREENEQVADWFRVEPTTAEGAMALAGAYQALGRTADLQALVKHFWRDRTFGKANTLLLGNKAMVLDEDGQLAVATLAPQKLDVHSKCKVLNSRAWTPPVVAGSRLYVRDQKEIAAFDLR